MPMAWVAFMLYCYLLRCMYNLMGGFLWSVDWGVNNDQVWFIDDSVKYDGDVKCVASDHKALLSNVNPFWGSHERQKLTKPLPMSRILRRILVIHCAKGCVCVCLCNHRQQLMVWLDGQGLGKKLLEKWWQGSTSMWTYFSEWTQNMKISVVPCRCQLKGQPQERRILITR